MLHFPRFWAWCGHQPSEDRSQVIARIKQKAKELTGENTEFDIARTLAAALPVKSKYSQADRQDLKHICIALYNGIGTAYQDQLSAKNNSFGELHQRATGLFAQDSTKRDRQELVAVIEQMKAAIDEYEMLRLSMRDDVFSLDELWWPLSEDYSDWKRTSGYHTVLQRILQEKGAFEWRVYNLVQLLPESQRAIYKQESAQTSASFVHLPSLDGDDREMVTSREFMPGV